MNYLMTSPLQPALLLLRLKGEIDIFCGLKILENTQLGSETKCILL